MTRRIGTPGKESAIRAIGVTASTDRSAGAVPSSSSATAPSAAGFTASTMTSLSFARSRRVERVSPPTCPASASARGASRSQKIIASGPPGPAAQPRAIAPAMFPAPANPSFIAGKPRARRSGLVEESLFDEAGLLLGRDLDVARRQQEGLVRDLLHPAAEGVGEARGEVDEPLRELGVRRLQIQDHRRVLLELVGDLLRVVEAVWSDEMHPDVRAVAADRAQHPAAAAHRLVVVREDVVDLVARAPALPQGAHGGATRRGSPVEVLAGLRLVDVAVAVPRVLGQAEVDKRAMPCVAEGHCSAYVRLWSGDSCRNYCGSRGCAPHVPEACAYA